MFDIGFSELLLIAVVALVVLGPERLPKAARFAGLWVRRARHQWESVKQELERELEAEELKRSLHNVQDSLREAEQHLHEQTRALHEEVRSEVDLRLDPPPPPADAAGGSGAETVQPDPSAPPHSGSQEKPR